MNELAEQLKREIAARGPMPFAEFMTRALYDPAQGYYRRVARQTGRAGDFYTSVSVGSFFGELLAYQFARWFETLKTTGALFQIVEAGAHDGQLGHDILSALRTTEPELFASVEYWIIDASSLRRESQQRTLTAFPKVRWFDDFDALPNRVHGVIFSNELLDALPVHPFIWNAPLRRWDERGVTCTSTHAGELFTWTPLLQPTVGPPALPEALLEVLPDGYLVELSPAATQWWRDSATALAQGKLMTVDYGGEWEELLSPARTTGTLRAYSRHRVSADVLSDPGGQDITAQVNFTALREAGEEAGLITETFATQGQFLTGLAHELWTRRGAGSQNQTRQFQTLTHPEHLGRPFRVLVQSSGMAGRMP